MVALANESYTDMWINIPGPATDDYVERLASLIKNGDTVDGVAYAGLKPGLKVYVEYSNEVWGGIQNTYQYNNVAAPQAEAAGDIDAQQRRRQRPGAWGERYYLQRTMQLGQGLHQTSSAPVPSDNTRSDRSSAGRRGTGNITPRTSRGSSQPMVSPRGTSTGWATPTT